METVAVEWCDRLLTTMWQRLGRPGLAAAASDPGLAVELIRHESEVRSWLAGQGLAVSRPSIAGYTAVLLAAAQGCGRRLPPAEGHDWSDPEWYLLRLLALCVMSRAH